MDISKDKAAKYLGTALVSIAHLDFSHPCGQIDRKVIEQLKRYFEGEGCMNEDISNRVPVMIDNQTFHTGLEKLSAQTERRVVVLKKTICQSHQNRMGYRFPLRSSPPCPPSLIRCTPLSLGACVSWETSNRSDMAWSGIVAWRGMA